MGVELKVEIMGTAMFGRKTVFERQEMVVLLLGRGEHHAAIDHRPVLVVDPRAVKMIRHLPIRTAAAGKHRARLLIDISGLDLHLSDTETAEVAIGGNGANGPTFSRVVDMDLLRCNQPEPFSLNPKLTNPDEPPEDPGLVVGRLFMHSGRLSEGMPFAEEFRNKRFTFKHNNQPILADVLTTDRTIFRCRLTEPCLQFERSGHRQPRLEFEPEGGRPIKLRLVCLPVHGADGEVDLSARLSHFDMAYDTLLPTPSCRPLPDHVQTTGSPVANCFDHGQTRA
jgi:hypothetical protein